MVDLSDFGGGIVEDDPEPEPEPEPSPSTGSRRGRCRAVERATGDRCGGPATGPNRLCESHREKSPVVTIDSDPSVIIGVTSVSTPGCFTEEVGEWSLIARALDDVSVYSWVSVSPSAEQGET